MYMAEMAAARRFAPRTTDPSFHCPGKGYVWRG